MFTAKYLTGTMTVMTDLTAITLQANALTLAPDEDKLEAFLQAYKDLPQPGNLVETAMYEVLLQLAIEEYMETPCTCEHEEEAQT